MIESKYDIVMAGAGHNGLVVGCYLAKAGLKVCVVERQDVVGGGVVTRELTVPGFKHDLASTIHGAMVANPMFHRDELQLVSEYGLKYIWPDPQLAVVFPDDRALVFYRDIHKTCDSIAQFSERDAEMYPKFIKRATEILKMGGAVFFSPPPKFGAMISVMDSSEEGQEYLRVIMSSAHDMAEEWFESQQIQIALGRWASEMMIGPAEKGTGAYAFGLPHIHRWGLAFPEGGSGMLSEALAACLKDHGGEIRISSSIKAIKVENGEAKGVVLDSGEEILAEKAVVSNLNAKQLFLEMLRPELLPEGLQEKIRRLKHSTFQAVNQALALNEAPEYKAGTDVNKAGIVEISPLLEGYLKTFDEFRYGIPSTVMPTMSTATTFDPTRAPKGKHTLYLYHFAPYNLKDGGAARWDEIKQEVADGVLDTARQHITNLGPENILGRCIFTPLDLERYNPSFVDGDIQHIGPFLSQFFGNRPLPGWGQYRTPVKKLYMCGGSTHPGGGVTGGGRATVQVVMEDLGIDFKKVLAR